MQHRRPRTRHDKTRRELGRATHMATPSHTFCARRCARPTVDACTPAGACYGEGMGWVDGCTVVADCITRSNYYCCGSELRAWCVSQFLLSAELRAANGRPASPKLCPQRWPVSSISLHHVAVRTPEWLLPVGCRRGCNIICCACNETSPVVHRPVPAMRARHEICCQPLQLAVSRGGALSLPELLAR